jgi:hypothetical protein
MALKGMIPVPMEALPAARGSALPFLPDVVAIKGDNRDEEERPKGHKSRHQKCYFQSLRRD